MDWIRTRTTCTVQTYGSYKRNVKLVIKWQCIVFKEVKES